MSTIYSEVIEILQGARARLLRELAGLDRALAALHGADGPPAAAPATQQPLVLDASPQVEKAPMPPRPWRRAPEGPRKEILMHALSEGESYAFSAKWLRGQMIVGSEHTDEAVLSALWRCKLYGEIEQVGHDDGAFTRLWRLVPARREELRAALQAAGK